MVEPIDPVELTQRLVCCPSVTPAEAGALDLLVAAFLARLELLLAGG